MSFNHQSKDRSLSMYLTKEDENKQVLGDKVIERRQTRSQVTFETMSQCKEEVELISEIRQLRDDIFIVNAKDNQKLQKSTKVVSKIPLIEARRRDRHTEAHQKYGDEVKAINEDSEVTIIQGADHVKKVLAVIDAELQEIEVAASNSELLLSSENENMLALWKKVEGLCERRTDEIACFASKLDEIEQTRVERVRVSLQRLTRTLMEIVPPPEVERFIEVKVYEQNIVTIANQRVYADLIARMEIANIDVFTKARLEWERGQICWRRLRHDDSIARFQAILSSPQFTDPEDRQSTFQQMRVFQEQVHCERLRVLKRFNDAGPSLSSDVIRHTLKELSASQQLEKEKTQAFFLRLRNLNDVQTDAAKALRETLCLELHGFGAMAKEGAIEEARSVLMTLLSDDTMNDLFRVAIDLKAELDTLVKKLCVPDLIRNTNLEPIMTSVGILVSALPLESVSDKQGKGAERKAMQSTLEKMRNANGGEIMPLILSLRDQIGMLTNLVEMNDTFNGELCEVIAQLDTIIQESDLATRIGATTLTAPQLDDTNNSFETIIPQSPRVAVLASTKDTKESMTSALDSEEQCASHSSCKAVNLQAIRKVQRRLGIIMYASELSPSCQQHLHFIADQLLLQTTANRIVDEVIARECDNLIATRQQESCLLILQIEEKFERQNTFLHEQVVKLAKFFLQVSFCIEESADKIQYVNSSVMVLLDTLKKNNEATIASMETKFQQSCARLRHSPNERSLRDEFQQSLDTLTLIENEYRSYDKRVSLAADNSVIAISKQRVLYLQHLCNLFGLKPPSETTGDETFDFDYFLSVQYIEHVLNAAVSDTTSDVILTTKFADMDVTQPDNVFQTASGLELAALVPIDSLARSILKQLDDEEATSHTKEEMTKRSVDEVFNDPVSLEPGALSLLQQTVFDKVQTECLALNIPNETVESLLINYRAAILSKYDSDTAWASSQTEKYRQKCHVDSSTLLEDRLRILWQRKGRLDVRLYQPRMSELGGHHQRHERHLREVWMKIEVLQTAFARKVEDALIHIDQTRTAQVNLQAQLPLQTDLSALQGLDVKAKKNLRNFLAKTTEIIAGLHKMTEDDINSIVLFCQDYIRGCSSQLSTDLTSCDIVSGCDYHPDEIAAIKVKCATIEAQARDYLSEREKRIVEISEKESEVVEMQQTFDVRYQSVMQSVALQEGLGQKFGLPRRVAQERYRSEKTRCDSHSLVINTLLTSLQSLVDEGKRDSHLIQDQKLTCRVFRILLQLRAMIYHRGMYFGFLRYPCQLELKPIEFKLAARQHTKEQEVICDEDLVEEEDRTVALPFWEFTARVGAQCLEAMKALYQEEGKSDELPPSGIPVALEEYLSSQQEKNRLFVLQQEKSYREQVNSFAHLLTLLPEIVVTNFKEQAKQQMRRSVSDINVAFEAQFESSMSLRNQNILELRPHLCSPNSAHLLQELEERESRRSNSTQIALRDVRSQFLTQQIHLSLAFEVNLVELSRCLMQLLDSSVLSLEDLKPSSDEETPKLKRKSLKRLRKVARVNESGDPRQVPRTAAETQKLSQSGEALRFPLRSWSGIPKFGLQPFWEEVKAAILSKDKDGHNVTCIQNLVCEPLASSDGACVSLLTPSHRVLVRARDRVYADYVEFCRNETFCYLKMIDGRLEDEIMWMKNWDRDLNIVKQQRVSLEKQ